MKILFVPPYSLPVANGGFENQVYNIYNLLVEKGIDVQWLSFENVDVASFDLVHLWSTDVSMIPIARIFRNRGIPVVITPMAGSQKYSNIQLRLFRILSNIPCVCSGEKSVRFLYSLSDYFFPLTPFEKKRLECVYSINPSIVTMIPNGIDKSFLSNRVDKVDIPYKNYIITVGRIEPNKNQLSLIKAANKLGINVIVVGGDGVDKHYVKRCKNESGRNIFYWGIERNPYILKYLYMNAQATIIPSYSEMAPLVAFESLSMGTPVICTKKCGISCNEYNGIRFIDVDVKSIMKSLSELKYNEPISPEGIYSWEQVVNSYMQIYSRILDRNAAVK